MKRVLTLFLLLAFVISSLPATIYAAEALDNELLVDINFDNVSKADITTTGATGKYVDSIHKKAGAFSSFAGSASLKATLAEPCSEGVYALTFDYKTTQKRIFGYVQLVPSNSDRYDFPGNTRTVCWVPNERLAGTRYQKGAQMREDANGYAYANEDWCSVAIWLDFINRKMIYMVDGTEILATDMNQDMLDVKTLDFTMSRDFPGLTYIDNIKFYKIKDLKNNSVLSENTPENYRYPIVMNVSSDNVGNVFYDRKDFGFKVDFCEFGAVGEFDADYKVVNEYGDILWSETEELVLEKGKTTTKEIKPIVAEYGLHELVVEVSSNGELVSQKNVRCSKVNAPDEGVKNKKLGINLHTFNPEASGLGHIDYTLPLVDISGIGFTRDNEFWTSVEAKKGELAIPERVRTKDSFFRERDIEILAITGGSNATVYGTGELAAEGKNLDEFYKYLDYIIEYNMAADMHYYEINNEPNLSTSFTPEDYGKHLVLASKYIKSKDPDAYIVAMCLALAPVDWTERVLIAMGSNPAQYMDAVSFHPYSNQYIPEKSKVEEYTNDMRELLDKYNCQNVPLWITELGWSAAPSAGYIDEKQQSYYAVRMLMLNDARRYADVFIWYNLASKYGSAATEYGYGIVRDEYEEVPCSAKYSYVSITNYNKLLGQAECVGEIRADEKMYIYRYKVPEGKDIVAMGTYTEEYKPTSLYVGADKVNVYDIYGNKSTLSAINGIVTLPVNEETKYIEGDFADRVYEVEPLFSSGVNKISTTTDEDYEIKIQSRTNADLSCDIKAPSNMTVNSAVTDSGYTTKAKLTISGKGEGRIFVELKHGEDVYFSQPIDVTYTPSAELSDLKLSVHNGNYRRRFGTLTVTNLSDKNPLSGELTFTKPQSLAKLGTRIRVENIAVGGQKEVIFNFPEISQDTLLDEFEAKFVTEGGEVVSFTGDIKMPIITKAKKSPTIDGVLSAGEWNYDCQMDVGGESNVMLMTNYHGTDDLSGRGYAMWDNEHFYYAIKVTDDIFDQTEPPERSWAADGLQLAFAKSKADSAYTEIGVSIYGDKVPVYCFSNYSDPKKNNTILNSECAASRDGNYTIYEIKIPWSELLGDDFVPTEGMNIAFSMLMNEADGTGRKGFIEYGGGIGTGKTPSKYLEVTLDKVY